MDRLYRRTALTTIGVCLVALTACTSSGHANHTASPAPSSATGSGTSRPKLMSVNPLTGGKVSQNPVVAVKIEDTAAGRPQVGIDKADIVYIEQAEGGLTRILAIFNTTLPTVEPVRSTRAGDPELASQFGPILYVASGGSHP